MRVSEKELFYNTIADEWEGILHKTETQKRLTIVFEDLFSKVDLKNNNFLEVGCGLGFFSKKAVSLGAKVTGIDVGPKLIKKCRKLAPQATFKVASATNLPFNNDSFDIVLCTEVIEHVDRPEKAVAELIRVVKPAGLLVITSPNKLFKPIFDFFSLVRVRPYHGHEKWFTPRLLKKLITDNGGKIKKERFFNFIYPHKVLDVFEKIKALNNLMINQGYLVTK